MDGRPTWTDCDEAGDYVVPNVLSPRDLVSRPDNMDETVPHMYAGVMLFPVPRSDWHISAKPVIQELRSSLVSCGNRFLIWLCRLDCFIE